MFPFCAEDRILYRRERRPSGAVRLPPKRSRRAASLGGNQDTPIMFFGSGPPWTVSRLGGRRPGMLLGDSELSHPDTSCRVQMRSSSVSVQMHRSARAMCWAFRATAKTILDRLCCRSVTPHWRVCGRQVGIIVLPVYQPEDIAIAIRLKLILEVSGLIPQPTPSPSRIERRCRLLHRIHAATPLHGPGESFIREVAIPLCGEYPGTPKNPPA